MPLTPCLFTNTSSIPVGATKLKAKEHKSSKLKSWRFRLVARTHASHAWNTGSIPVGATSVRTLSGSNFFCVYVELSRCEKLGSPAKSGGGYAKSLANLKKKNLISVTPLSCALKDFIFALKLSAKAFVDRLTK